jgi:selT/selW/selH-like putative selenoprotein
VAGATGAFEIIVDGRPRFSKLESRRFPTDDEIDELAIG